jgi:hypothetical protein
MIAKKHIKAINELLNSESAAQSLIDRRASDPGMTRERMAHWVDHGRRAATELMATYGIQSSAGSIEYWESMAIHFPLAA